MQLPDLPIIARYPGEDLGVSESEARRAVEIAERVRQAVRGAFQDEGFDPGGAQF
jgi:hypothetical protein